MPVPTLETDRLILRPITEADVPAVFAACSNPNVAKHTRFEVHRLPEDTRAFVRDYALPNYEKGLPDPLVCLLKADPAVGVIGAVGVHWASEAHGTMECGYWLAEPYWGRGLAAEAVRELARLTFERYPIHRLQAHVMEGNQPSGRVLEKAGFLFEGVLRKAMVHRRKAVDVRMYSRVREDK